MKEKFKNFLFSYLDFSLLVGGYFVTTLTLDHSFTANNVRRIHTETQPPTFVPLPPPTTTTRAHKITRKTTTPNPSESIDQINEIDSGSTPLFLQEVAAICGQRDFAESNGTGGFIRNGAAAIRGQFPWLIALYQRTQFETNFLCGGSLITRKLVITAAHCIQNKKVADAQRLKPENALFYAGKHDIYSLHETKCQNSVASQIFMHPEWDPTKTEFHSDIAIAVLKERLIFTNLVSPICIWTDSNSYDDITGKKGQVAGWGLMDRGKQASQYPRFAVIPAVDNWDCSRSNRGLSERLSKNTTFCAGKLGEDVGPCNGDSGESLVFFFVMHIVTDTNQNFCRWCFHNFSE